ncbi:hypothetical protein BCV70DRAFT_208388 [Testicularia cyperi]|uniref:Uncharacterized protein n=1 Tax=Testicularia cyperi TaxID=1882483 RepID=A0A317XHB0_9BASI|nr:hypothetical protein BCV70DRAFT_208388 [Testicularia cyperi]
MDPNPQKVTRKHAAKRVREWVRMRVRLRVLQKCGSQHMAHEQRGREESRASGCKNDLWSPRPWTGGLQSANSHFSDHFLTSSWSSTCTVGLSGVHRTVTLIESVLRSCTATDGALNPQRSTANCSSSPWSPGFLMVSQQASRFASQLSSAQSSPAQPSQASRLLGWRKRVHRDELMAASHARSPRPLTPSAHQSRSWLRRSEYNTRARRRATALHCTAMRCTVPPSAPGLPLHGPSPEGFNCDSVFLHLSSVSGGTMIGK